MFKIFYMYIGCWVDGDYFLFVVVFVYDGVSVENCFVVEIVRDWMF